VLEWFPDKCWPAIQNERCADECTSEGSQCCNHLWGYLEAEEIVVFLLVCLFGENKIFRELICLT